MTADPVRLQWPAAVPPPAEDGWRWDLSHVSELPAVRAQLRRGLAGASSTGASSTGASSTGASSTGASSTDRRAAELDEAVVLAFDEMASNALRHGGGGVTAQVKRTARAWLVEVCDQAPAQPPRPAVGRDPSQGGLGLYLIAEMADAHGWHSQADVKSVWALLPRR